MPGDLLAVNEIFGPTIQGEGRYAGAPAIFVRLARCNLDCTWCDTPYTWDWKHHDPKIEIHLMGVEEVVLTVLGLAVADEIVVVSGGEPLLQGRNLQRLVDAFERPVHVETNGTVMPIERVTWYSISPKLLPSAGIDRARALRSWAMENLAEQPGAIKLVVSPGLDDRTDVSYAADCCVALGFTRDRIDLMPEGATPQRLEETAPLVARWAEDLGLGFTPRLHVTLFGGGRGI